MKLTYVLLLTAFAAGVAAASPLFADPQPDGARVPLPPGGPLNTMPQGTYECALPGDATGPAFRVQADEEFRIGTASRYNNAAGKGLYIMRGDELTFTLGPKKDQRYRRVGTNQLRQIVDGEPTKLLCTRMGGSR